jgi:hypothetical protein
MIKHNFLPETILCQEEGAPLVRLTHHFYANDLINIKKNYCVNFEHDVNRAINPTN